jgi:hypothetical protein
VSGAAAETATKRNPEPEPKCKAARDPELTAGAMLDSAISH